MQPNEITLSVDTDNDPGTAADVMVYSRYDDSYANRSVYIEKDNHSVSMRKTLSLYRTAPKESGNFRGVAKSAIKLTTDRVVPGVDSSTSLVAPQIIDIGFANPVGLTPALTLEMRMMAVALLTNDEIMAALADQLMI